MKRLRKHVNKRRRELGSKMSDKEKEGEVREEAWGGGEGRGYKTEKKEGAELV